MVNIKKLDSNMLKFIAIIAMTVDHIAWAVFPGYSTDIEPVVLHIIGRITCPIMCYFIAEGYHYTRNINKYTISTRCSLPISTVRITSYSSKAKWSCFKTESLSPGVMLT